MSNLLNYQILSMKLLTILQISHQMRAAILLTTLTKLKTSLFSEDYLRRQIRIKVSATRVAIF